MHILHFCQFLQQHVIFIFVCSLKFADILETPFLSLLLQHLFLTNFWNSEQRIYRANYEKTRDKFTITTDDPRYQLARENRKMSQVTVPDVPGGRAAPTARRRSSGPLTPGAWGRGQTCRWGWSPHGCDGVLCVIVSLPICDPCHSNSSCCLEWAWPACICFPWERQLDFTDDLNRLFYNPGSGEGDHSVSLSGDRWVSSSGLRSVPPVPPSVV